MEYIYLLVTDVKHVTVAETAKPFIKELAPTVSAKKGEKAW